MLFEAPNTLGSGAQVGIRISLPSSSCWLVSVICRLQPGLSCIPPGTLSGPAHCYYAIWYTTLSILLVMTLLWATSTRPEKSFMSILPFPMTILFIWLRTLPDSWLGQVLKVRIELYARFMAKIYDTLQVYLPRLISSGRTTSSPGTLRAMGSLFRR